MGERPAIRGGVQWGATWAAAWADRGGAGRRLGAYFTPWVANQASMRFQPSWAASLR